MANVTITLDTSNKGVSVVIDGVTIDSVVDGSFYAQRDSNGNVIALEVGVYTVEKLENGVRKRVSYYAEGSEEAQRAIASGQTVYKEVSGFVGVEEMSQAAKDIDEFLSSKPRRF